MRHSQLISNEPALVSEVPAVAAMPELSKLMTLRNALVALKGPLANTPGSRQLTEQLLQNNDFYERVLGKLTPDNSI